MKHRYSRYKRKEDEYLDKKLIAMGTSMLLLKLLENHDMYGYQMIKELEMQSEDIFSLKEGTLYPLLHLLEQQEAITSYEKIAENGRMRKYYHLTEDGKRILLQKKKEWDTYQKAVNKVMGGLKYAY